MHKGKILSTSEGVDIIDCQSCGFVHVNPLPTQFQLDEFYSNVFYQEIKKSYFENYESDYDWWCLNYNWLLDDILELSINSNPRDLKLLDVGSGPGLFLRCAKDKGFNAIGLEPSIAAFEYSQSKYNVNVNNVTLDDIDQSMGKFDIIHNALVLEHILDPLKFILKIKSLLNKNGLIITIVPNDFNYIQEINVKLGQKHWWVNPFEHLNYFKKKSLRKLMKKAGFEILHESVTFPIDLFLLMDQNYIENNETGRFCHNMRKNFEFNLEKANSNKFRKKLYKQFSKLGIGRELIIIARKTEN